MSYSSFQRAKPKEVYMSKDLSQLSTADIQQMRANACVTYGCMGHKKAYRNGLLIEKYDEELTNRGETPWSHDKSYKEGRFNGEGSS